MTFFSAFGKSGGDLLGIAHLALRYELLSEDYECVKDIVCIYQGHLEAVAMSWSVLGMSKIIIALLFFAVTLHHFGLDRERLIYHVYVRCASPTEHRYKICQSRLGKVQDLIWLPTNGVENLVQSHLLMQFQLLYSLLAR